MFRILSLVCLFALFVCITATTHAQSSDQSFHIDYDNGLLTLSAENADLTRLLTQIAQRADIHVHFPKNLTKQITITLSSVSLKRALRRLLKGEDYALLYSVSGKHKPAVISEVYVLPKSTGPSLSRQYERPKGREEAIRASITRYEKRLETLKSQMTTVDEESRRGRLIGNQIRSTEKIIERLQKSLER